MFAPVRVLSENSAVRVELARYQDGLVVIKKLRQHSPFMKDRLEREAKVLRKLKHDHIVPLLFADGDQLVYAYCPGVTLGQALEGGPLPIRRSLKIATDILKGLEYAHQNGVIHFDVKPDNIIVRGEHALLGDFGFAKDLGLTAITSDNVLLGTPNYMAPEQFRGERNDPRSDLFSVGAVLYHMVMGQPPYGRQMLQFLVGDRSVKLEALPKEAQLIADVVYRSLAYLPEHRFPSAADFRQAITDLSVPV
ncbi:MAG: serine/threonine protein kinase [Chloroflexi bacterium AL-N5]|nr:serine/threonine protein kinase [Chloroflexi bacterium AL-N5]